MGHWHARNLWLPVSCNFDTEEAIFSWSADGKKFTSMGDPFTMEFQLTTFQDVRLALFNFNSTDTSGGYANFDDFNVDEPRSRGIERMIPNGKTITLSSGADGSMLAADTKNLSLINVAADNSAASGQNVRFQVVDLGKGRVALKAANGLFVSANDDGISLKDLAGKTPGATESFQWINLMRGDTMLMSLVNHRYVATAPDSPGLVTVSSTGPRPDRKDGACFKWKIIQ